MSEFITKDSGERKVFNSGMQRDTTTGKLFWALVYFGPMLKRWVALLTRGAIKYDRNNWMKANGKEELERFRDSAARHFAQWMAGERDEDHAAAVFFNINGAEYVLERLRTPDVARAESKINFGLAYGIGQEKLAKSIESEPAYRERRNESYEDLMKRHTKEVSDYHKWAFERWQERRGQTDTTSKPTNGNLGGARA